MNFVSEFVKCWNAEFDTEDKVEEIDVVASVLNSLQDDRFMSAQEQLVAIEDAQQQSILLILNLRRQLDRQEFVNTFLERCRLQLISDSTDSNNFEDLALNTSTPYYDTVYFGSDEEDRSDRLSVASLDDYLANTDGLEKDFYSLIKKRPQAFSTPSQSSLATEATEEDEFNSSNVTLRSKARKNRAPIDMNATQMHRLTLTQRLSQVTCDFEDVLPNDRSPRLASSTFDDSMLVDDRSSSNSEIGPENVLSELYQNIVKTLRRADEANSNDRNNPLEIQSVPSEKHSKIFNDRLAALRGILEDERSHLEVLRVLQQYQKGLESTNRANNTTVNTSVYGTIFFCIAQLLQSQQEFVQELEQRISVDSKSAGSVVIHDLFHAMATKSVLLKYLDNVPRALSACEVAAREDRVFRKYLSEKIAIAQAITSDGKKISQTTHFSIEDLIALPTKWLITLAENMRCLLRLTPESHEDCDELRRILSELLQSMTVGVGTANQTRQPSDTTESSSSADERKQEVADEDTGTGRQLVMQRFLVELTAGRRRLRRVFLFTDLLVCAKDKLNVSNIGGNMGSGGIEFASNTDPKAAAAALVEVEVKWYIPLFSLALHKNNPKDDINLKESRKTRELVKHLKQRITELRADIQRYRSEFAQRTVEERGGSGAGNGELTVSEANANLDFNFLRRRDPARRLEKKEDELRKLQGDLLLACQNRPLVLSWMSHGAKVEKRFLLGSEPELMEWQHAIQRLHANAAKLPITSRDLPLTRASLSLEDVRKLLHRYSRNLAVNHLGSAIFLQSSASHAPPGTGQLEEAGLVGVLRIVVHRLEGLEHTEGCFVTLELDSLSRFMLVAKSTPVLDSSGRLEQDFDVMLDGSETTLRCWVRRRGEIDDAVLGRLDLRLQADALRNYSKKLHSLSLSHNPNEKCLLVLSLRFQEPELTLKRCKSIVKQSLFGTSLEQLQKHYHAVNSLDWVPELLTTCVQCIEARGLREPGLYRISASSIELQQVCRRIEAISSSSSALTRLLQDQDVHLLANLVKKFFRELTDPVFTTERYIMLRRFFELKDEVERRKAMLSTIASLPEPNRATAKFILHHLVFVSREEAYNRMSLNNLALIFGPTLLSPPAPPANKAGAPSASTTIIAVGGLNAVLKETSILIYLLKLVAEGALFVDDNTRVLSPIAE